MGVLSVFLGLLWLHRVSAACHSTCRKCFFPGMEISCTGCYAHAHTQLSTASLCLCDHGWFPSPSSRNCVGCHADCLGCSSTAQNACNGCPAGSHLSSGSAPSACVCDVGYPNPDAAHCTPCDLTCLTCSGLGPNACVTCRSLAQISLGQCVCKTGFFPNPTSVSCSPCFPTCPTCSNALPSSCLSCPSNAQLVGGTSPSFCVCLQGFFLSADSTSCQICDPSCQGCVAAGENWCLGCYSGASLYAASPSACVCSSSMFSNPHAGLCTACSPLCNTCAGSEVYACLSCKSQASLVATAPNECSCDFGYYGSPNASNCQPCDSSCLSCSGAGANQCQTCQSYAALIGSGSGSCGCVVGFFPNPHAGSCTACDLTCASCLTAGETGCSSCKPHATKVSSGSCECDAGYFLDLASGFCLPCDSSCLTCASSSFLGCLSCKSNAFLPTLPTDQCVCLAGFYPNPDSGNCALCSIFCGSCLDGAASSCLSCKPNANLVGSSPSNCGCNPGFYGLPDDCQPCHLECLTCSAGTNTDCHSCKLNAVLSTTAPSLCQCIPGYYLEAGTGLCSLCDQTCLTCLDGTVGGCTACKSSAVLSSAVPSACVCLQSAFPDPDAGTCQPCSPNCLTCIDSKPESCKSCKSHALLLGGGSVGFCGCKVGFYGSASECQQCDSRCLGCEDGGIESCSGCFPNAHLAGGIPSKCQCAESYFPSPDVSKCAKCSEGCFQCESLSACIICNPAYTRITGSLQCITCPQFCLTCDSNFLCSQCVPGKHLNTTGVCKDCEYCGSALEASVTSPFNSTYEIAFGRPIIDSISKENFYIRTEPPVEVNWTVSGKNPVWVEVEGGPWPNNTLFTLEILGQVRDEFGTSLLTRYFQLPPPLNSIIIPPATNISEPTDLPVNDTLQTYTKTTGSAVVTSALVSSATAGGGGAAAQLLSSMQYFSYISSTRFPMTEDANGFYSALSQKYILPNFFARQGVPYRRLSINLETNEDFLETAGPFLSLAVIVIAVHVFLVLIQYSCKPQAVWFQVSKQTMQWSIYFFLWCFLYLDLQVYALRQARAWPAFTEGRAVMSALGAVCCLVLGLVTPFILLWVLFSQKHTLKSWRFLVISIRPEGWSRYYYVVFFTQRLIYAYFVALLLEHPNTQSILFLLPVVLMLVFVSAAQPLQSRWERGLQIAGEVDAVAVYVLLCVFTLRDSAPDSTLTWVLIGLTLKSFVCSLCIVLIIAIRTVKNWCLVSKSKSAIAPEPTIYTDTCMEELPSEAAKHTPS